MKRIKKIVYILGLIALVTGCCDDFMDRQQD